MAQIACIIPLPKLVLWINNITAKFRIKRIPACLNYEITIRLNDIFVLMNNMIEHQFPKDIKRTDHSISPCVLYLKSWTLTLSFLYTCVHSFILFLILPSPSCHALKQFHPLLNTMNGSRPGKVKNSLLRCRFFRWNFKPVTDPTNSHAPFKL